MEGDFCESLCFTVLLIDAPGLRALREYEDYRRFWDLFFNIDQMYFITIASCDYTQRFIEKSSICIHIQLETKTKNNVIDP